MRTRFAKVGDAHVAYATWGEGPLDLLYFDEIPVDMFEEEPRHAAAITRLASIGRLIAFNPRGLGLSDRLAHSGAPTMEERSEDAVAVLDAVGSKRAAALGMGFNAHPAIDFAARRGDRTSALVLCNARARWLWAPDYPFGFPESVWQEAQRTVVDPDRTWAAQPFDPAPGAGGDAAFWEWWQRAGNRRASPAMAAAVLGDRSAMDLRPCLGRIEAPTLVLQRTDVDMLDVAHGRYLAEHIRGARLVELPGADMLWFVGDAHAVLDEIESFLGEGRVRKGRRALASVLFADLVSSTQQAARLGDQRWREVLGVYHDLAQRAIERFGGRRISTAGDGLLATFEMPAEAVRCGAALADGVRGLDVDVRVGVHTGEVEIVGDDIAGLGVHIAARVMSAADPGEVLVSRTVVDLVTGSGLAFDERGERELKGVPGRWALYALQRS